MLNLLIDVRDGREITPADANTQPSFAMSATVSEQEVLDDVGWNPLMANCTYNVVHVYLHMLHVYI